MNLGLALLASYALGSIPAAYIAGKSRGVDLRKHGSGNLGATNVFRVLGSKIGTIVFLFDMAKGAVPVIYFARWAETPNSPTSMAQLLCGVAAIAGHVRPLWLGFKKGGKGVATAAGVFLALAPVETLLALLVFGITLLASGYVSLGSLLAAVVLPVLIVIRDGRPTLLAGACVLIALFVFWSHRANIRRLRQCTENRFGKKGDRRTPVGLIAAGWIVVVVAYFAIRRHG